MIDKVLFMISVGMGIFTGCVAYSNKDKPKLSTLLYAITIYLFLITIIANQF